MGNQIIFIFVEVDDWCTFDQDQHRVFLDTANEANAVPDPDAFVEWHLRAGAAGLGIEARADRISRRSVALVSDELIETTDWEVNDLAIQVVRDQLRGEGKKPRSWQSSRQIDPSLWFEDEEGPACVIVRAVRYPESDATMPADVEGIRAHCARISRRGFIASVAVARAEDPFDPDQGLKRLYREHGMHGRFAGLQALEPATR
jgi:hypothetical protein